MSPTETGTEPFRRQLDKILSSRGFVGNERLSKFLRFVVERQLQGKADELKESLIGIEVFGRMPGFDPRQDSVVRTEAARLRLRLSQYYAGEGGGDAVVIELPKGGYIPVFRQPETVVQRTAPRRPGTWGWLAIALAGLALVLAVTGWWWAARKIAPIPIAVLPLHNLSEDPANDYFADGLTYEIIRNLSIIEGLAVRSQTSSFAFKGKPRNIREAGKQLDAEYILEGSVLRSGKQLRINALLVRVRDDFPLWSGKFDRELTDVFAIQDEISRGIVNSLRLKLGNGRRRYETSPDAYDLYLRARALPIQRGLHGYNESISPFKDAIARDPSFAPAYAGLAAAHATRSGQFRSDLNPAAEMSQMWAAAKKAVQLDPLLAEAHYAMGMAYSRDGQWEQSEKSFRQAIEMDGSGSMLRVNFAAFLLQPLGRIDEALHQLRIAEKADPLSSEVHYYLWAMLGAAGRGDEAVKYCDKLPPDYWAKGGCLARVRLHQGRVDEAIQMLEPAFSRGLTNDDPRRGFLGCAYALAGRREDAQKIAVASPLNPFNQARIFACLGDKDRTFEALDRAAAVGPFRMGRALTVPEFAVLRGDPRVKALRKKVGLPE